MFATQRLRFFGVASAIVLSLLPSVVRAQQNQVLGEIRFAGATKAEKDSGVWVDGQYVGYLKELNWHKKVMLLPGNHEITTREAGYKEFSKSIVVEPGQPQLVFVKMEKDTAAQYPGKDAATLKLNVMPERAAVFVDDGYVGHASDFGGSFHSMLVAPGEHHIKVDLPGYRTFETNVNILPGQKAEIKTKLVAGSIEQADSSIRP
jgi:hypothetical protein